MAHPLNLVTLNKNKFIHPDSANRGATPPKEEGFYSADFTVLILLALETSVLAYFLLWHLQLN